MNKSSQKNIEYKNKYNSEMYDRLNIMVPKGRRKDIRIRAESKGMTINSLVNSLLQDDLGMTDDQWKTRGE